MVKKLGDTTILRSGYAFRNAVNLNKSGNTCIIQAKNVCKNINIDNFLFLEKIDFTPKTDESYLKYNDVLLVSRSSNSYDFRSCVFKLKDVNAVASNTLCILRVTNDSLLPEYLSLYLNSKEGQKQILKTVSSGVIQTIFTKNLQEIYIPIPPLVVQENLIKLNENILKQEKIYQKKIKLKNQIITQTFTNIINQNK